MSIYTDEGYKNRRDYLEQLADDFGVDPMIVFQLASILGSSEDFERTGRMTEVNGLPNCGDCVYAREHVNIKGSPCYDCRRRNKFIKAVEQGSTEPANLTP